MKFNDMQIKYMKSIGIKVDLEKDVSDISEDDIYFIEEKISNELQTKGFDKAYKPTVIGEMCESILDML